MIFTELTLSGAYLISLEPITDTRGFFSRVFCEEQFAKNNLEIKFVQSNMSYNFKKNTLRGMHYQVEPYQEVKLVKCTNGSIFDVIIDLRPNSITYKKWVGANLSRVNNTMIYVPKGFAHGYLALEDNTEVFYWVSEFYNKNSESGIRYDDPSFNIQWPVKPEIISDKDQLHPMFNEG